jgi:hypothetical protein
MIIFIEDTPNTNLADLVKIERGLTTIATEISKIAVDFIALSLEEAINFDIRPGSKVDRANKQVDKIKSFVKKLQTTANRYKFSYPNLFKRYENQIAICHADINSIQGSLNEIWERGTVTAGVNQNNIKNIDLVKESLLSFMNETNRLIDIIQAKIDAFNKDNYPLYLKPLTKIMFNNKQ